VFIFIWDLFRAPGSTKLYRSRSIRSRHSRVVLCRC